MARRKAGKRLRANWRYGFKEAAKPARSRMDMTKREQRHLVQMMISGAVFVLLVAVKLLLPEEIGRMGEPASRILEQNMDVVAVFSAVGRAFSGKDTVRDSLGDVYQAVFGQQNASAPGDLPVVEAGLPEPQQPFRNFIAGTGASNGWLFVYHTDSEIAQSVSGNTSAAGASRILYSDENLPQNVQLQQTVLGFDYCAPVSGTVTSGFGYREYPADGAQRFHYGLDLTADSGTAIAAFADGTVTVVGESSSYGKYLMITHPDGCSTLYAHCSTIHARSGQSVKMGEVIAEMGDTGQATGVHLHFELQQNGVYLNPIYYAA